MQSRILDDGDGVGEGGQASGDEMEWSSVGWGD